MSLDELAPGDRVEHGGSGRRGTVRKLRSRWLRPPQALIEFDEAPTGPYWTVLAVLARLPEDDRRNPVGEVITAKIADLTIADARIRSLHLHSVECRPGETDAQGLARIHDAAATCPVCREGIRPS